MYKWRIFYMPRATVRIKALTDRREMEDFLLLLEKENIPYIAYRIFHNGGDPISYKRAYLSGHKEIEAAMKAGRMEVPDYAL